MSKIFFVLGKSCSGKDTIFRYLKNNKELNLKTIVGNTFKAGSKIIGHCILVKLLPGKSPAGGAKPDNIEY